MAILSKACKPDNFKLHSSLKRNFMIIRVVRIFLILNISLNQTQTPDILALCDTNLGVSIDSGNFSMRGYLPLI